MIRPLLLAFVVLSTVGCGPPPVEPKLSAIQKEIFQVSCSISSCHGGAAQAGLSLLAGDAFSELINVAAEGQFTKGKGLFRVVPGKPDESLIVKKIEGPPAGLGARMPDVQGTVLDDDRIETIRQWIANGAVND